MNYKLEKFWNEIKEFDFASYELKWTINLKSFEIVNFDNTDDTDNLWTINLKSFEICLSQLSV